MIIENVNTNKLHDELVAAGINPWPVDDNGDGTADITFPEGTDMVLVQQIIDAHDPTPLPQPLTEIEQLRLDQAKANAELVDLILLIGGMPK